MVSATIILTCLLLLFSPITPCAAFGIDGAGRSVRAVQQYVRAAQSAVLQVFQVYPPVITVVGSGLELADGSSTGGVAVSHSSKKTCQETLVVHSFAYSYGDPYVGPYTPPSCSFNRVTWNLTVTSAGRQFDRLGTVSFGDIELFRTSTAEPTQNGIIWTYLKDMTNFLSLFQEQQTIIFDLGNLISDIYTGDYNVTLTASFFTASDSITPADLIIPVSRRQGSQGQPSYFTIPDNGPATDVVTLPRNIKKAVFTVAATGQAEEEFWWSNVLQSEVNTFPSYGTLYGYSPFREVQLFIDKKLAGVAWPYPVIFTGGVVPGLWRPIVGIDAFDLKENEIDITPWLPLLCDGKSHNFTINVSGLNDNGNGTATLSETTDSNWQVVGKVFVWSDTYGHVTTGSKIKRNFPKPSLKVSSQITQDSGTNETLIYQVNARRNLLVSSTINTSEGQQNVTWSQSLTYSNFGNYTEQGNVETNIQNTTGYDQSSSGYAKTYNYPLYAFSTFEQDASTDNNVTLTANVQRGKTEQIMGQPVFPTGLESFSGVSGNYAGYQSSILDTTQNGTAFYTANSNSSFSFGTTTQDMTFAGVAAGKASELFHRYVEAVNGTVTQDQETLIGQQVGHRHGQAVNSNRGQVLSGFPGRGDKVIPPSAQQQKRLG